MSPVSKKRRILFLQYTNPGGYPPLVHSSGILAERDWEVLFLGTGALGANSLTVTAHPNICVKKMTFCQGGWKQKLYYLRFHLWCAFWVMLWRPDWVYASDILACSPTLLIHTLFRTPFIYHEHDAPAPGASGNRESLFLRLSRWARRHCARRADLCVIPNEMRAEKFRVETETRKAIGIVWNCPRLNEVSAERPQPGPILQLLYHGSIVPERLPLSVLDGLARVSQPVLLKVVGYETVGSRGYLARLQQKADDLGIRERLQIIGAVPTREDLMRICLSCDAGLSLLPNESTDWNLCHMAGASNKAFDYLACGLAVVVPTSPEWRRLFVDPGYGLDCDSSDPASIASAAQWFCDHPDEMREMGRRGRERVRTEWNYESQFQSVLDLLCGNPGYKLAMARRANVSAL